MCRCGAVCLLSSLALPPPQPGAVRSGTHLHPPGDENNAWTYHAGGAAAPPHGIRGCAAGRAYSALCWIRGVVAADKLRLEIVKIFYAKYYHSNGLSFNET